MEAPCYARVQGSRLLAVERAVPLAPIANASGRVIDRPVAKFFRFLRTDGPVATLRKARAKRREPHYVGDYHVVAAHGRCMDSGEALVCIAPRSVPAAQYLLVHEALCQQVDPGFGSNEFAELIDGLSRSADLLAALGRQTYLYSRIDPPPELVAALGDALSGSASEVTRPLDRADELRPPAPAESDTVTALRVKSAGSASERTWAPATTFAWRLCPRFEGPGSI